MSATRSRTEDGRRSRSDGERSRRAILDAAARLATVEGLEGLSIGRLADHIGMSKSGLYAHFGSKEELQLAAIDTAEAVFAADVVEPAAQYPDGLPRLHATCERFLSHVERGVFPGGCFFASVVAELDTRPGRPHDRVVQIARSWMGLLVDLVRTAQAKGELSADEDADQLAFEIDSMLLLGNAIYLYGGDAEPLDRARRGIAARLERAKPS